MTRRRASEYLEEEKRISSVLDRTEGGKVGLGEEAGANAGSRLRRAESKGLGEEAGTGAEAGANGAGGLRRAGKVKLVQAGASSLASAASGGEDDGEEEGSRASGAAGLVSRLKRARKEKTAEKAAERGASEGPKAAAKARSGAEAGRATKARRSANARSARRAGKTGASKAPRRAPLEAAKSARAGAGAAQANAAAGAGAAGAGAGGAGAAATAGAGGAGAAAGAAAGIILLVIAIVVYLLIILIGVMINVEEESSKAGAGGAEKIVAAARAEYERGERDGTHNEGGERYWKWYGKSSRIEWCCCFVTYCADQCGFVESGLFPKSAHCGVLYNYFRAHEDKGKCHDSPGYVPKTGDLAFDGENHVAIVEKCDGSTFTTYEGNSPDVTSHWTYSVGTSAFSRYVSPAYPAGGSGALMEGVDFSIGERAFVKLWGQRIDAFFKNYNPAAPLNGHGKAFAQAAWDAHFDPRFLPAVSIKESSGGLYVPSYSPYNCYGWGVTDSGPNSEAYTDGYDAMIHHIIVEGVLGGKPLREYTSVDEIGPVYCSSWPSWIPFVKEQMTKI